MPDPLVPDPPAFPQEFSLAYCPVVQEAREWAVKLDATVSDATLAGVAECAFVAVRNGLKCETCRLDMYRPDCGHEPDRTWLERLEQYYRELDAWADADWDANHAAAWAKSHATASPPDQPRLECGDATDGAYI